MESSDLVVVSTFPSPADAQIAKGVLEDAGIESLVRADNAGGMIPALGGVDVLVRADAVQLANEALHRRHNRALERGLVGSPSRGAD